MPQRQPSLADAIGARLRAARESLDISQSEVARRLDVPVVTYGAYERGKTVPSVEMLSRIALILRRPLTYFLGIGPDPGLSEEERRLLSVFRAITLPFSRAMILQVAEGALQEEQKRYTRQE